MREGLAFLEILRYNKNGLALLKPFGVLKMNVFGKLIKEFRVRNSISQEELAYGLCAVSSLSRIESGEQAPGRKLQEALLSRMGIKLSFISNSLSNSDFIRFNLEERITAHLASGNYEIKDFLDEYKQCSDTMDKFEEQTYLFFSAIYNAEHGMDIGAVCDQLQAALDLTSPGADAITIDVLQHRLFTSTELLLLNNMALYAKRQNQNTKAISIMTFLKTYFETHIIAEQEKAKNYTVILFNLSNWLGMEGNYEEAYRLADEGLDISIKYGKLFYFPRFIFNKGYSLAKMNKKEEGRALIAEAFMIYDGMKNHDHAQFLAKQVNEIFHFDFPIDC